MNEQSSETVFKVSPSKLFQPIVGVILGIFVFLILLLLTVFIGSEVFRIVLLSPGYLVLTVTMLFMDPGFNKSTLGYNIFVFLISIIPFIMLGPLMVSQKSATRTIGIVLLVIYSIVSVIMGVLVILFGLY